jgi:hypothetical protein
MGKLMGGQQELAPYRRQDLEQQKKRNEGRQKIFSVVALGAEQAAMDPVLDFYEINADVFVPPTVEQARTIFSRDIGIARRHLAGVTRKVNVNGDRTSVTTHLGDLIAETRGRNMEIDALLAGKPIPTAPSYNSKPKALRP